MVGTGVTTRTLSIWVAESHRSIALVRTPQFQNRNAGAESRSRPYSVAGQRGRIRTRWGAHRALPQQVGATTTRRPRRAFHRRAAVASAGCRETPLKVMPSPGNRVPVPDRGPGPT
jgi:hypothetical protein